MGFHLFYCYGVFLFALVVIEVATITPYDVTAITSGNFSGGPGCFVYYPQLYQFEFIANTYDRYEEIKDALVHAGDDKGMLLMDGNERDMLLRAYYLMSESLYKIENYSCKEEGAEFFYIHEITSYSYSNESKSLQFQYDCIIEVKEVEIIFSDDTGLKAITDILSDAGITCKNV